MTRKELVYLVDNGDFRSWGDVVNGDIRWKFNYTTFENKPLYMCSADMRDGELVETDATTGEVLERFKCVRLRSYATNIGVLVMCYGHNYFIRFGTYSATSTMHARKFIEYMSDYLYGTLTELKLFRDTTSVCYNVYYRGQRKGAHKWTAKTYRIAAETDFCELLDSVLSASIDYENGCV